jgi:hypothetical protein
MTATEWLMLLQTLIIFISGITQAMILIITGAIVAWYTYETHKIRNETSIQNSILAEQLLILRSSHEFEMKKDISFIEPVINFDGGSHGRTNATLNCTNKGGPIRNARIITEGVFDATIRPNAINAEDRFYIILANIPLTPSNKVTFEIEYKNKLGEIRRKKLEYNTDPNNLGPKEIPE